MENESLDSVNEYFKHLGQVTQELNREEIAALWKRIKQGDKEAKNKMMGLNLRLVIPTAKRFQRPGMDLMDLIEEGNLGLLQAIDKFEPEKGYRFSTYAVYWIEQYIRKYIEESNWDEWLDRAFEWLDWVSWAVIFLAVLYFGPTCAKAIWG